MKIALFGISEIKTGRHNLKDPRFDQTDKLVEADKKTYAQLLAGAAELGVVVAGEEKPLAGITQFLNVAEIISASFEAAQAIAKSA